MFAPKHKNLELQIDQAVTLTVTVNELKVSQYEEIYQLFNEFQEQSESGVEAWQEFLASILPYLTDLDMSRARDLTPSQLRAIYEAVREVNADFFEILTRLGIDGLVANAWEQVISIARSNMQSVFLKAVATSTAKVTAGVDSSEL